MELSVLITGGLRHMNLHCCNNMAAMLLQPMS